MHIALGFRPDLEFGEHVGDFLLQPLDLLFVFLRARDVLHSSRDLGQDVGFRGSGQRGLSLSGLMHFGQGPRGVSVGKCFLPATRADSPNEIFHMFSKNWAIVRVGRAQGRRDSEQERRATAA
jgi:hypothetical protein